MISKFIGLFKFTLFFLCFVSYVAAEDSADIGRNLFIQHCSSCHQVDGQGKSNIYPPLAKSPFVQSSNVERLASVMLFGLAGEIEVLGQSYNNIMPGLFWAITDKEYASIAHYVRSSWGNQLGSESSLITEELFAKVRKKYGGGRGPFSIEELGKPE